MWEQIKEKYGTLRLYAITTDKIQDILDKYEYLSICYCERCGKPARYKTKGWVEYYCKDCMQRNSNSSLDETRLTKDDIPVLTTYKTKTVDTLYFDDEKECEKQHKILEENDSEFFYYKTFKDNKWQIVVKESVEKKIDIKEKYGIDFKKMWDLTD